MSKNTRNIAFYCFTHTFDTVYSTSIISNKETHHDGECTTRWNNKEAHRNIGNKDINYTRQYTNSQTKLYSESDPTKQYTKLSHKINMHLKLDK